jgi:hypothetical protein
MSPLTAPSETPILDVRSHDAVVVIPGIMGSDLHDLTLGKRIWGADRAAGYAFRWRDRSLMMALAVTDEERSGEAHRVKAKNLVGVPHLGSVFGGLEPYGTLVRALQWLIHPDAVLTFAYDWRLSVAFNAPPLAEEMHRHLAEWHRHPEHERARRLHPDGSPARLVLVAHSMGGLLVQAMAALSGALDDVRAVVTLGTPFYGSVLALQLLATGDGAPLPLAPTRLREVARTMPGVYDLLPSYRCLRRGDDVVALQSSDVASVGGDPELAKVALAAAQARVALPLPCHRAVIGVGQTTPTSMEIADGHVTLRPYGYRRHADGELMRNEHTGELLRWRYGGDATVFTEAAAPVGTETAPFAQQHGRLPGAGSIQEVVTRIVGDGGRNLGAGLGDGCLGLDTPSVAVVGEPLRISIRENDPKLDEIDPARLSCLIENPAQEDEPVATVDLPARPGNDPRTLEAEITLNRTGLFRIVVSGGGDPITRLLLVQTPEDAADAALPD